MKKILSLFLLLVLCFGLAPAVFAEGETEIASAQDMLQLGANPQGRFVLTSDIDMSGVDWVPVAFEGTLLGNGHTVYNLTVTQVGGAHADTIDGNDKVYDSVFSGLFSTLIDARIEGLTLRGVDIDVASDTHCFVGAIAGYIRNSEISDCRVLDARVKLTAACQPEQGSGRTSCNAGVGGIAGFGCGTVNNCSAGVTLVFDDQCDRSLRCEEFLGGVLSCGNIAIRNTSVDIRGYCSCRGYAHNGGLVGMFYQYDKNDPVRPVNYCAVNGSISFFEDNRDRRAYCQAFAGELLTWTDLSTCSSVFNADERFDYTQTLRPELCAEPSYTETVHDPSCEECGYTTHTCSVCGNTWNDSFVLPSHVPGEWETVKEATYTESGERQITCTLCGRVIRTETVRPHVAGEWVTVREAGFGTEGLRQLLCADCGAVLEEEILPARTNVQSIVLDPTYLTIEYKDDAVIRADVYPANAESTIVHWSSSDTSAVKVDTDGTVHAVGPGSAVVTCTSADGFASAECHVSVHLSLAQWFMRIIRFEWLMK